MEPIQAQVPAGTAAVVFCPRCGQKNAGHNFKCLQCGTVLHGPGQVVVDNTLGGLIPYKNALALWAYYLGVFSLIPLLGIPLGIAAFVLGIMGVKYSRAHPEAKGLGHAITGIVLGSLSTVGYPLLIAVLVAASRLSH